MSGIKGVQLNTAECAASVCRGRGSRQLTHYRVHYRHWSPAYRFELWVELCPIFCLDAMLKQSVQKRVMKYPELIG